MKKLLPLFLILALGACVKGTVDIDKKYYAYVHQVINQSKTEKTVLANVGDYTLRGTINPLHDNVKLVLKNCTYDKDWVDDSVYSWTGNLVNTGKSYSFTTVMGATRTVPVFNGDCLVKDTIKAECFSWQDGCVTKE